MTNKDNGAASAGPINEQGATAGHNVAVVNQRINDGFAELLVLDRQIEAARAQHVKPLQAARTKAARNLKADTDIEAKDLKLQYALYRRQEEAKALDDDDDRNRILDNMRTVFGAMVAGQTLDFVDVLAGGHTGANAEIDAAEKAAEAAAA